MRRLLELFDPAGQPPNVESVANLGELGVRRARADVDLRGDPYFPFQSGSVDDDLALALGAQGKDRQMVLLVGGAMAGKSRTGVQALRTHPALSRRVLLVPQRTTDLDEFTALLPPEGGVIWLDDLNTYRSRLSAGLLRSWQARSGLVVIATLRQELLSELNTNTMDLQPIWAAITDSTLVNQITMPDNWDDQDQDILDGLDPVISDKIAAGYTLGEILGAADVLLDQLRTDAPFISDETTEGVS